MHRRDFLLGAAASSAIVATPSVRAAARFQYLETSVAELQARMSAGRLTARTLAAGYLARIGAIDRKGPRICSVIELNPDALATAAERDRERKAGVLRGPLHGIPVLLKDNIATRDRMSTSAGSLALANLPAPRDAFLVARMRDAGAVILGKTNLSEWANFRSTRSSSGWSARGGLTRNPYALDRSASGSSSGSAAAIAASLAAVAVGTETDGSITSPASKNGLVGLKPTVGLVSRDGIVPIASSQDTAGPMARTVADAAALLGALAGTDARDSATHDARGHADYMRFLDKDGLRGARLGVARGYVVGNDRVQALFDQAVVRLKALGAEVVDPVALPPRSSFGDAELEVLLHEFKAGLASYLAEFAPGAPIRDIDDLIAYNERDRAREMPFFGQELLVMAAARGGLDSAVYRDALARARRATRDDGIDKALSEHRLDALIAPTGGPAWLIDLVNGDNHSGGFTSPAAVAGVPHITVPMGQVAGLPVGLSFVGPAWSEPVLLRLAYAFEQATQHRRVPTFARTVDLA
ncbi:MAG: amidase [Betaproteobacteria bacterium]|nr:amidase [Betaproteobacteria bacterium]